jgi:hypothetical protein
VFVSDNGGAFKPLLAKTTATSTTFTGQNGHSYGFYSIATDQIGAVQPTPSAAQASTTVDRVAPTSKVATLPALTHTLKITLHWSGSDSKRGSGIATYDVYVSDNGGKFKLLLSKTAKTSFAFTGKAGHKYGFYSVATDNVGNRQATPSKAQATTRIVLPAPSALGSREQVADLLFSHVPRFERSHTEAVLTLNEIGHEDRETFR